MKETAAVAGNERFLVVTKHSNDCAIGLRQQAQQQPAAGALPAAPQPQPLLSPLLRLLLPPCAAALWSVCCRPGPCFSLWRTGWQPLCA